MSILFKKLNKLLSQVSQPCHAGIPKTPFDLSWVSFGFYNTYTVMISFATYLQPTQTNLSPFDERFCYVMCNGINSLK